MSKEIQNSSFLYFFSLSLLYRISAHILEIILVLTNAMTFYKSENIRYIYIPKRRNESAKQW